MSMHWWNGKISRIMSCRKITQNFQIYKNEVIQFSKFIYLIRFWKCAHSGKQKSSKFLWGRRRRRDFTETTWTNLPLQSVFSTCMPPSLISDPIHLEQCGSKFYCLLQKVLRKKENNYWHSCYFIITSALSWVILWSISVHIICELVIAGNVVV